MPLQTTMILTAVLGSGRSLQRDEGAALELIAVVRYLRSLSTESGFPHRPDVSPHAPLNGKDRADERRQLDQGPKESRALAPGFQSGLEIASLTPDR